MGAVCFLANDAEPRNSSFSLRKEHIGYRDCLFTQGGLHCAQMEHSYIMNPAKEIIKADFFPVNYLEFLTFCSWDWHRYRATVLACH